MKRLRLTYQDDQVDSSAALIIKLKESSDSNINELIDSLLKFCNDFDRRWIDFNGNEIQHDEVLKFLLDKYDFYLKNCRTLTLKLSTTKARTSTLVNNQITVGVLLLRCIYKVIKPQTIAKYSQYLLPLINQTSSNNKLLFELFKIIEKTLDLVHDSIKFKESLLPYLKKSLKNNDHRLREVCLRILSLHFINYDETFDETKIIQILFNHIEDQDARVRVCSLELLMELHEKGHKVDVKYYEVLKHLLSDDFDQVRLLTSKMLFLLGMTYPEQ